MELTMFMMFVAFFIALGIIGKKISFLGIIGGIGLILLGLTIQTQSIQIVTGLNETTTGSNTVTTYIYQNVQTVFPDLSVYFLVALTIILAGAGIIIMLQDVGK